MKEALLNGIREMGMDVGNKTGSNHKEQRYSLLCRAIQAQPEPDDPLFAVDIALSDLDRLIRHDLLVLARQASPDDFAELYLDFERELAHFREFAAYPHLASKTVVAFGGGFSAGKSSLINVLMGEPLMVVEVDPTTALPAYVLAGDADAIYALNAHSLRITLNDEEFASLTHEERVLYGSDVSRTLSAAFVIRKKFPWKNLAFIDTPGYSGQAQAGGRTDASIALSQLNSANAIVWVVNAKQGTLPESDIEFLAKLEPTIPKIVVLSRADQINETDRETIVKRISATLAERNLMVSGVFVASANPRYQALLSPIQEHLAIWNKTIQTQTFSRRFKTLFVRYKRGLDNERREASQQQVRLNRLISTVTNEGVRDAESLHDSIFQRVKSLEKSVGNIQEVEKKFFSELKRIGGLVGIPLPEPSELELIPDGKSNIFDLLFK